MNEIVLETQGLTKYYGGTLAVDHIDLKIPRGCICGFVGRNGAGKTTAEMQTAGTFLDADWDFIDETANGTENIWWILEGQDYPRLCWEAAEP